MSPKNAVLFISSKFAKDKVQNDVVLKSYMEHNESQRKALSISPDVTRQASTRHGTFHQILATCSVFLLGIATGTAAGYTAILLPQLYTINATSNMAIDIEMGSWIASIPALAYPFGALISGPLADYVGRRATLLGSIIPLLIGWCATALTKSHAVLLVGRFICGVSLGLFDPPAQIYVAETTEPNLRNLLIGAPFVAYSLGILIVYVLGSALHWRTVAWWGNTLPILAAIALFVAPETPVWLIRQKKFHQAKKALNFLRGNEMKALKEFNELSVRLQKEPDMTTTNENVFKLCCQREAFKPLCIVIILFFLQMVSGTFLVVFFAVDIISEFGTSFDANTAAIWTAAVRMIFTMIVCVVLLFVRRRRIIIIASLVSGLSCLVLSIYMYMHVNQPQSNTGVIVATSCLLIYIAFNTPLMIMSGIMVGEILPSNIRGRTAGGVCAAMNVVLFGLTKAFPLMRLSIGLRGVFMMFAVASLLITLTMFLLQPETKGRTLEQIEDYFKEDNWFWFNRDKRHAIARVESSANKDCKECLELS